MNIRRQTLAASQSRNPRFHSNSVLKLGRVSRSIRYSGGTPRVGSLSARKPVRKESSIGVRQTPVYNMLQKIGSNGGSRCRTVRRFCISASI